ncbi:hypothetical protein ACE6H2_023256 [Prunus campanulata]
MELKVIRCPYLRTFASKVVNTHSVIQVYTELGKSEWMGDLNSTIGNIHEKSTLMRRFEFCSEEFYEDVHTNSTELVLEVWNSKLQFDISNLINS